MTFSLSGDGGNFPFFLWKDTGESYCFLQYYLFFFNPEVNITTENITEYVIVRGFNIASCSFPVLPLCFFSLSPLMLAFTLNAFLNPLVSPLSCALPCSIHLPTPSNSNRVLCWHRLTQVGGTRLRPSELSMFSMFLSFFFFFNLLYGWIWKSKDSISLYFVPVAALGPVLRAPGRLPSQTRKKTCFRIRWS